MDNLIDLEQLNYRDQMIKNYIDQKIVPSPTPVPVDIKTTGEKPREYYCDFTFHQKKWVRFQNRIFVGDAAQETRIWWEVGSWGSWGDVKGQWIDTSNSAKIQLPGWLVNGYKEFLEKLTRGGSKVHIKMDVGYIVDGKKYSSRITIYNHKSNCDIDRDSIKFYREGDNYFVDIYGLSDVFDENIISVKLYMRVFPGSNDRKYGKGPCILQLLPNTIRRTRLRGKHAIVHSHKNHLTLGVNFNFNGETSGPNIHKIGFDEHCNIVSNKEALISAKKISLLFNNMFNGGGIIPDELKGHLFVRRTQGNTANRTNGIKNKNHVFVPVISNNQVFTHDGNYNPRKYTFAYVCVTDDFEQYHFKRNRNTSPHLLKDYGYVVSVKREYNKGKIRVRRINENDKFILFRKRHN